MNDPGQAAMDWQCVLAGLPTRVKRLFVARDPAHPASRVTQLTRVASIRLAPAESDYSSEINDSDRLRSIFVAEQTERGQPE